MKAAQPAVSLKQDTQDVPRGREPFADPPTVSPNNLSSTLHVAPGHRALRASEVELRGTSLRSHSLG